MTNARWVSEEMRFLSVRQPWASMIIYGLPVPMDPPYETRIFKDVENRTWTTRYRGPMAIHAGRTMDMNAARDTLDYLANHSEDAMLRAAARRANEAGARLLRQQCILGAIIGVATLTNVISPVGDEESPSEWGGEDCFHWYLTNPMPITPIPFKGGLGLKPLPHAISQELSNLYTHKGAAA